MAAITWRNVDGGADYRGAALMLRGAQEGLEKGIAGFQGILKDRLQLQDENKANTVANNEAEIRRMINSAGSVDQLKQMQDQGLVQKAMERMGTYGVGRNFDPTQLLRAQQEMLRDSELKDIQYTDAQNKRAADPILQEYQALLFKDPKAAAAFLTPEREAILRTSNYLDDAAASADTRGETLKSRDRATTTFNNSQISFANQQNEVAQRNAERASLRAAARVQQEALAAGGTEREIRDRLLARLSSGDSGVLPEHLPQVIANSANYFKVATAPTAKEQAENAAAANELKIKAEYSKAVHDAELGKIQTEFDAMHPAISKGYNPSMGDVTKNIQAMGPIDRNGIDWFTNTGSQLNERYNEIETKLHDAGIGGEVSPTAVLEEAAKRAAEGSKGDQTVYMNVLENQIPNVINELRQQRARYIELAARQKELQNANSGDLLKLQEELRKYTIPAR